MSVLASNNMGTTPGIVPVAPYNARNTDDPNDIKCRIEDCIEEHSKDVQLKQLTLYLRSGLVVDTSARQQSAVPTITLNGQCRQDVQWPH